MEDHSSSSAAASARSSSPAEPAPSSSSSLSPLSTTISSSGQARRALREKLGRSYDAVVLDLHDGLDADGLAQAQGYVWGGGALILRLPADDVPPTAMQERLAVFPHGTEAVGDRLWRRLRDNAELLVDDTPLAAGDRPEGGSEEQAALVERLIDRLVGQTPSVTVLTADRGRGKSSAVGLALGAAWLAFMERRSSRGCASRTARGSRFVGGRGEISGGISRVRRKPMKLLSAIDCSFLWQVVSR